MPASKIFDVMFGAAVLGTVGVLTGLSMGVGFLPAALLIGMGLGAGVGSISSKASNIEGYTTQDYKDDVQVVLDYIMDDEDDLGDTWWIGDNILNSEVSSDANSITVKTTGIPVPIFRFGCSIGWAF